MLLKESSKSPGSTGWGELGWGSLQAEPRRAGGGLAWGGSRGGGRWRVSQVLLDGASSSHVRPDDKARAAG